MSKTKEMFLRVTQQHVSATDKFLDDSYRYEQYMAELKQMEQSIHNQIKSNERSSIQ